MDKEILKNLILIIIVFSLVGLALIGLSWLLFDVSLPDPPSPKVAYGEFPFSLIYEIDGERVEIKDTLVIEHLGKGIDEGNGKYNKWNFYYKNSQEYISTTEIELFSGNNEKLNGPVNVVFAPGSCEYYMGLPEKASSIFYKSRINPGDIFISYYEEDGDSSDGFEELGGPSQLKSYMSILISV